MKMKVQVCLASILLLLTAQFAFAQNDPTHEASVGYSFLGPADRSGWVASFGERLNDRLWIKFEAGGNYRRTQLFGDHPNFVHSILAGVQIKFRKDSKLVPWTQVLAGITMHNHPVLSFSATGTPGASSKTDGQFAFQPGAGIDYYTSPRFGLRFGADYRRTVTGFGEDFYRLHGGIVLRFGGK
jgi:hypothetical protein